MDRGKEEAAALAAWVVGSRCAQRDALVEWLESAGIHVSKVLESAEDTLLSLGRTPAPDVIVTAFHLPDLDGWRLCRLLRTPLLEAARHVEVVIVSDSGPSEEEARLAAESGARAFLPAPLERTRLIDTIHALLGEEKSARRRRASWEEENAGPAPRLDASGFDPADERLAHSHALMSYVIEHCRSAVAVFDRQLRYIYVSMRYLDEYKIHDRDVIGRCHYDVFPDLPQEWREIHQKALRGEISSAEDDFWPRDDGEPEWVRWECRPWYEADESIGGIILYTEVITERKRIENALRQSEEKFRRLFETMVQGVVYQAADGAIIDANPAAEQLLGMSLARMKGRTSFDPHWQAIHEDGSPFAGEEHPAMVALRRGQPVTNVVMGICIPPDHRRKWLLVGSTPQLRDGEEGPCGVFTTFTDITTLKDAEDALKLQEQELREAQRIGRSTSLDHDVTTNRVTWSDQHSRLLGQPPGFSITRFEEIQEFYSRETWETLSAAVQKAIATGAPFEVDLELVREDGTRGWHTARAEAVRAPDGTVTRLRGTIQDITERKQGEMAKARLEAELQHAQKLESVGRLAGGVAHDFNNMLVVILGHAELALMTAPPDPPLRRHLQEIRRAAERSADLTRQLLAFARKQTVSPRTLDLNRVVVGTLEMIRRLIGENIDLRWIPGPALWPVRLDSSQVEQILANLCVNARDAIAGAGQITIETANVSLDGPAPADRAAGLEPGDYVRLEVRDNGSGMSADTLARAFEPFYTTKASGKGTGLGLATVYGIVTQNHGAIRLSSESGRGTVFEMHFPRHRGEGEKAIPEALVGQAPRGHETILLVEDNPTVRDMGQVMLESLGYRALVAATAPEAMELAEKHRDEIRLLLTDVIMPQMNGPELVAQLVPRFPGLKVLYMSGYPATAIASHGVLDEGVHYLQKPFTMTGLANKLQQVLLS